MIKKIQIAAIALLIVLSGNTQIQPEKATSTTDKFAYLLSQIDRMYVEDVDAEALTEKAIVAMLLDLDPHSVYMSKEEMQEANEPLQGSFDGIGVQFQIMMDTIYVVTPIVGGPSEKLGIMAGDKIVEVNGENVAGIGITNNDVQAKLKGPKGTKVKVGIKRKSTKSLIQYEIVRDKIPIHSLDASYMATPEIGYIKVSRFAKTTMEELHAALTDLKSKGMKDLVLDLQGNGGGLLNTAVEMADEFLGNDRLLVYTEGRSFAREDYKAHVPGLFEKGRLVVLIDEASASASEIVSGAVQDWDRGLVIGRRSFGKGLVQKPIYLPDGSAVRLTTQKYYTPSGRCIQKSYEDGAEEYFKEKYARWESGEYFHADSIHVPDSLKFVTNVKKRTVYGGGGIMPDVFVPVDTTDNSDYFTGLLRTGVTNTYSINYVDKNRADLKSKYPTLQSFITGFQVSESMMKEQIAEAEKEKIKFNEEEFQRSKKIIELRTKALVARNLFDNAAFFQVINQLNDPFVKAIETLQNGSFEKMKLAYNDFK
ncbi:MAG: S41 family peptidase [Flavobacteriales bacterium]|mgnify:CR=1 FL=1|nr:S41 family peptidase [Flavobacteriales bacterium]